MYGIDKSLQGRNGRGKNGNCYLDVYQGRGVRVMNDWFNLIVDNLLASVGIILLVVVVVAGVVGYLISRFW